MLSEGVNECGWGGRECLCMCGGCGRVCVDGCMCGGCVWMDMYVVCLWVCLCMYGSLV